MSGNSKGVVFITEALRRFVRSHLNEASCAGAIICAFLIFNLATINQFGSSYDENFGMQRGENAIRIVETAAFGNLDEPVDSDLTFHPSFYATLNYVVNEFLVEHLGWESAPAGHLLNIVAATFGLVSIFFVGRQLFNPRVGLISVLFMVLFPRYIAHAHYNPKDVPLMAFGTFTLWLLYRAVKRDAAKDWIIAALSCAISVDTKLDGLFLIPIFMIPWLLSGFGDATISWRHRFQRAILFLFCSIYFIFMLWPALWVDPFHLFKSVSHFSTYFQDQSKTLMYLGVRYPLDQLPWHYMAVQLIVVTPVISLFAVVAGAIWSLQSLIQRRDVFKYGLLWCWLVIPLAARWLPGTIQYDGMRHVFLVVPVMALFAGIFIDQLLLFWAARQRSFIPRVAVLMTLALWLGWQIVQIHPLEGYYLNEGARRCVPANRLSAYFDLKGWGTIFKQGMDWINLNAPTNSSFAFGDDAFQWKRYPIRKDLHLLSPEEISNADYVIVAGWRNDVKRELGTPVAYTVQCYGADLLWILHTNATEQPHLVRAGN